MTFLSFSMRDLLFVVRIVWVNYCDNPIFDVILHTLILYNS